MLRTAPTRLVVAASLSAAALFAVTPSPQAQSPTTATPGFAAPQVKLSAELFGQQVVQAWQTGGALNGYLDEKMRKVVDQQTNGTGIYRELRDLGAIKGAALLSEQTVGKVTISAVKVSHEKGATILLFARTGPTSLAHYISLPEFGKDAEKVKASAPICLLVGSDVCDAG